jgi:hypothetical protein
MASRSGGNWGGVLGTSESSLRQPGSKRRTQDDLPHLCKKPCLTWRKRLLLLNFSQPTISDHSDEALKVRVRTCLPEKLERDYHVT